MSSHNGHFLDTVPQHLTNYPTATYNFLIPELWNTLPISRKIVPGTLGLSPLLTPEFYPMIRPMRPIRLTRLDALRKVSVTIGRYRKPSEGQKIPRSEEHTSELQSHS